MVSFNESNVDQPSHAQPSRVHSRGAYAAVDREVVSILGADCPLGKQVVAMSLRCGYEVQALTHGGPVCSPDKDLRVLASDTFDVRHIETVVRDSSCVINLCNVCSDSDPQRPTSDWITETALLSMKNARVSRYLCVTHQSVGMVGDARLVIHGMGSRYLWPLAHHRQCRDLQNEADLLVRSKLNWTLVRCPKIKNVASFGTVSVDCHRPTGRFVALGQLARYLVHLKDSDIYHRQAIFVGTQVSRTHFAT